MSWIDRKAKNLQDYLDRKVRSVYVLSKGCCSIEIENLFSSSYDIERLGFSFVREAESASLMLVSGWIDPIYSNAIIAEYEKLKGDKAVIAVGACAISGTPYFANTKIRLADILPVNLYVPGCPPRPEALIDALLKIDLSRQTQSKERMVYLSEVMKQNG